VPIGPAYIESIDDEAVMVRNYRGLRIKYPQPIQKDCRVPYDEVYFAGEPDDDDREGGQA
jgi:hypothetical protein